MTKQSKFLGQVDLNSLNPIKLVMKPSVAQKLDIKENTLEWFLCRADKRKDRVDLSGFGVRNGQTMATEEQLDNLKLSDYPLVFKVFLKQLKKRGFDMDVAKELHTFYFKVDYKNCEVTSELYFISKKTSERYPDGIPTKTPKLVSTF